MHAGENQARTLGFCIAGAAAGSGNLGVRALCNSTIAGLSRRASGATISVFDDRKGVAPLDIPGAGDGCKIQRTGARLTRRWHDPDSFGHIRVALRLGGLNNATARAIRDADAILDISGGDSFTDLYGPWRLRAILMPKQIAIESGTPLVLLPQTIGPFESPKAIEDARRVMLGAAAVWARDARSAENMRTILGDRFDPAIHREGVDVAFLLPPVAPPDTAPLESLVDGQPFAGVNVSGLIWNQPDKARSQYGFKADYRVFLPALVERLARDPGLRVLLVPHVNAPADMYESDLRACRELHAGLDPAVAERVSVVSEFDQPEHAKWLISRAEWFCGTRMHATIAGLSTGVPTAAVAYSPKTVGVFESVAQGEHVADPRTLDTEPMIDALWRSFESRADARASLAQHLPGVKAKAEAQLDEIVTLAGGTIEIVNTQPPSAESAA